MVTELKDYQVKKGDTFYSIAKKQFNMSVPELLKLNKHVKNPEDIRPGVILSDGLDEVKISKTKKVGQSKLQAKRDYSKIKANSFNDVVKITGLPAQFIRFIIQKEGIIYKAKKGLAGNILIGVGHNCDLKKDYKKGDVIKLPEVYTLLARDLMYAKDKLNRVLEGKKIPIGQECAAIDLMFNVGESVTRSNFMKHLKNGNFDAAVREIDYISADGKILPGLCVRRIDNIIQFCGGRLNKSGKKSVEKIYAKLKTATNNKQTLQEVKEKIELASTPVNLYAQKVQNIPDSQITAVLNPKSDNKKSLLIDG